MIIVNTVNTCDMDVDSIVHVLICIVSLVQRYSVLKVPINPGDRTEPMLKSVGKSCYQSYRLKKVALKSPRGSRGATVSLDC